ncbi:MAG: DUF1376 domain-containing protein [Planctomycetes bacterium]|nr:DUF1376 domain-containing protein [Planctomycetota bacterium]
MHWFKLYGTDYLGDPDVRELSMAERGALVSLWAACCARGGSLPDDMQRVSRMSDVPVEDCETLVPRFFEQRKDGEWESPRMLREWSKSDAKVKSGRAGGKARSQAPARGSASSKPQAPARDLLPSKPQAAARGFASSKTQASEARSQKPVPEPEPTRRPSDHPTGTADAPPPTTMDGWPAGREVVLSQEEHPAASDPSEAPGRILSMARRRAGPSSPVKAGRIAAESVAGLGRLLAGGAS